MSFKININIELKKLGQEIEKMSADTLSIIRTQIARIASSTKDYAKSLAKEKLNASAKLYQMNLRSRQVGKDIWEVFLVPGSKANMFEEGFSGFSLKKGLNTGKVKTSEEGYRYRDIPMNIKPTGQGGTGNGKVSQQVTDMRSAVAAVIKDRELAKKAKTYDRIVDGKNAKITKYVGIKNKSVEGLTKVKMKGKSAKYILFRRMSENPSTAKWQHPGFKGINIFENELPKYVTEQVNIMLKSIFG